MCIEIEKYYLLFSISNKIFCHWIFNRIEGINLLENRQQLQVERNTPGFRIYMLKIPGNYDKEIQPMACPFHFC